MSAMSHGNVGEHLGIICAGAYCTRSRRPRLPGLGLCGTCLRELADELGRLASLYQACERRLSGGGQRLPDVVKASGTVAPGMPFNSAAADTRSAIVAVLASWSGLVAQERRVTPPDRTVAALTRFLLAHAQWLAAHPAAPDLTREIRKLAGQASRVADGSQPRRIPVGPCVEPGCPGDLTAVLHPQRARPPAEICCQHDPAHRWPAHTWLGLGRRISGRPTRPAAQWLSAAEISRLRNTSPGSVYRLASEWRWRRRRESGHTYYSATDVEDTFRLRGV